MPYCPLCDKEYNKIAKVCPLSHCPNCGSLKIKQHVIRKFVENSVYNIVMYSIIVIIFGGMIGAVALGKDLLSGLVILGFVGGIEYLIYFKNTFRHHYCIECKNQSFSPWTEIKIKKTRPTNNDSNIQEDIEYEDKDGIIQKIDNLSKSQTKHHKRDMILKIVGISVTAIIGIAGLISNQEEIFSFISELVQK